MAKKKKVKANAEYVLKKASEDHKYRILAFDPGSRNMGVALVGSDGHTVDIVANSVLTNPITSMVDGHVEMRRIFIAEISLWIKMYKPNAVIMERFQSRGLKGSLIELVTTMNALISIIDTSLPYKFTTAATWKNQHNRRFNEKLEDLYKLCRATNHQLDASFIGVFGLELALRSQLHYNAHEIVKMVENTSCIPIKRERKTK